MAAKQVKKQPKENIKVEKKPGDIPTFKSPAKTLWGKIVIIIIVAAMILIPVIAVVIALMNT